MVVVVIQVQNDGRRAVGTARLVATASRVRGYLRRVRRALLSYSHQVHDATL